MSQLLGTVLEAHGGLDHWNQLATVRASVVGGGELWAMKGVVPDRESREIVVSLHEQWISVQPYGAPDQRSQFTPGRVAIEKLDGQLVAERREPRASFAEHQLRTPWDPLHRAYFSSYALWTYLTTPFHLAMPGFSVTEIEPVQENGELWRGLRAGYPAGIESHSTVQDFYVGEDYLVRRHDYHVEVAGGFPGVHYLSDYVEADGVRVPTTRRAYRRETDDGPILDQLMVSIDVRDISFS